MYICSVVFNPLPVFPKCEIGVEGQQKKLICLYTLWHPYLQAVESSVCEGWTIPTSSSVICILINNCSHMTITRQSRSNWIQTGHDVFLVCTEGFFNSRNPYNITSTRKLLVVVPSDIPVAISSFDANKKPRRLELFRLVKRTACRVNIKNACNLFR